MLLKGASDVYIYLVDFRELEFKFIGSIPCVLQSFLETLSPVIILNLFFKLTNTLPVSLRLGP
jgi:hypothetical protein